MGFVCIYLQVMKIKFCNSTPCMMCTGMFRLYSNIYPGMCRLYSNICPRVSDYRVNFLDTHIAFGNILMVVLTFYNAGES